MADIADYYHYEGRMDEAADAIELALQFNPDAIGPLLYKAREALSLNNFRVARDYAERIRIIDNTEYLYLLGEILICEGKTEEADELFRKQFMELPPDEQMDYVYDVANLFAEYNDYNKSFEWMARSQGDDSDDFKELMARTLFGIVDDMDPLCIVPGKLEIAETERLTGFIKQRTDSIGIELQG